jgi:outer membrane protein assembly factor BamD
MGIFLLTGCAFFEPKDNLPAQELAAEGMDEFESGDYTKAIEHFEKLKDWYPFSKFAILAELKIADAYYRKQEYEDAVFAYEEFENLHPRNEAIPYVIFQMGQCHFEQIDTIDRDQTVARNALEAFYRLINKFPGDDYAIKASARIKECLQSLAGHEFYVGMFYYKKKNYKAALQRFRSVLSNYPDVGIHHDALQYIAQCEAFLEKSN